MIKEWLIPGQTLAVGNADYKTIIEAKLGIYCLFNDAVMEVMWGLKNLMSSIVPDEKSDLADEDRPRMCQGMKMVLDRHNIYVKPEMINRPIIEMTCSVYECDFCVRRKHIEILRRGGQSLLKVSRINCEQWNCMKLATALKLVCYPEEGIELGNSPEMLSVDEARKLRGDAHQYEGELNKYTCLAIYKEVVWACDLRTKALKCLRTLVKEAMELSAQGNA
ncbi:hypothetical protein C2845_PM13G21730 [Panicum miliaceum]|uniref:Uncharacterized protein n=1 Tax=Panicum miliaceum TaxID=4540 RepID=A0A3L6RFI4_PANMI|nr:hypothetical protein C2845_PM13G21730 [Panicum miliaceum]